MKKFLGKLVNNETQIVEIVILVLCTAAPLLFNAAQLFTDYLSKTTPGPENVLVYLIVSSGNAVMAVAIFLVVLGRIRSHNKEFLMNRGNAYHQYPYWWYWFCAKILGIRRCSLVRVPIFMQFKLVIRGTFDEYPLDENIFPAIENEPSAITSVINGEANSQEINLILEDTYLIDYKQIPETKQKLRTIKVSRNDGSDKGRHFSKNFIDAVINETRNVEQDTTINIYATTNPMNTKHIASRAFALAGRGNIRHLNVFQQQCTNDRLFEKKGRKIY